MKVTLEDALSLLSKYLEERTPVRAVLGTASVSVARVVGTIRVPSLEAPYLFAMDANSHCSRPGPRIAEGILAMSDLFRQTKLARKSASAIRQPPVRLRVGNRL
jgi:hypothetical protein